MSNNLDIPDNYEVPSRKQMLRHLDVAITEAIEKIKSGRIYNNENERTRIRWLKCCGYLVRSYNKVLKEDELDELKDRLEQLEDEIHE